jgi:hypothetical protein
VAKSSVKRRIMDSDRSKNNAKRTEGRANR